MLRMKKPRKRTESITVEDSEPMPPVSGSVMKLLRMAVYSGKI